ncbi:MAG: aldo/keto reductase [Eubacteriales bacterium]|nr:aldo/keto reductase [Eubacteriales bacterium]
MKYTESYEPNRKRYETMQYRFCGASGLKLPVMSFGLWHNFNITSSYENCRKLVLGAFDLGITHFDLANNYGPVPGTSEQIFGEILKQDLREHRDELLITTKAGYDMWEGPYGSGGSKKYLISSLDQSLQRMGLDYVDIFYHHRPDAETPIEETAEALEQIIRQGKALYIGISNYGPEDTERMEKELKRRNLHCLIHQVRYSMLDQSNREVLKKAKELSIGTIAFCPLAQGLLTDKYLNGIPENSRAASGSKFFDKNKITPEKLEAVRMLNQIALNRGQSLAQMALIWNLQKNTSVILGASRLEQIHENVRALDNMQLTEQELSQMNVILSNLEEKEKKV